MQKIFRLDGIEYFWMGSGWVYADSHLAVPGVLGQALDHHFGHIVGQARPASKKDRSATSGGEDKGIQKTIGPIIVDFIRERYDKTHTFVSRDELARHLFGHPQAQPFLRAAYEKTEKIQSFEWYVGNQVDWFSANFGDASHSEYGMVLEKKELADGKKGYRPRWHTFDEGEIYYREDVVTAVKGWLPETGPEKMESKQANLDIIAGGPERIRFEPQGEGWGRSPGNAACWVDPDTNERLR
jgi:hypothetical protein